jgi:hypothetical protein
MSQRSERARVTTKLIDVYSRLVDIEDLGAARVSWWRRWIRAPVVIST